LNSQSRPIPYYPGCLLEKKGLVYYEPFKVRFHPYLYIDGHYCIDLHRFDSVKDKLYMDRLMLIVYKPMILKTDRPLREHGIRFHNGNMKYINPENLSWIYPPNIELTYERIDVWQKPFGEILDFIQVQK